MPSSHVSSPDRRAARASLLALIGFIGLSALVPLARAALAPGTAAFIAPGALYPLTGVAAWLVWRRIDVGVERKRAALRRWGWQLLLSGLWPAALYGAHDAALGLAVLALLAVALGLTLLAFASLQPRAALLLLPYCAALCWSASIPSRVAFDLPASAVSFG